MHMSIQFRARTARGSKAAWANTGGGGTDAETHGVSRARDISVDAIKLFESDAVNMYHQFDSVGLWPSIEGESHESDLEQFRSSAKTVCISNNHNGSKHNYMQTVTTNINRIKEEDEEHRTTGMQGIRQEHNVSKDEHRNGEGRSNSKERHKHNNIVTPTVKGAVVIQAYGHVRSRRTQGGSLGELRFQGRDVWVRGVSRYATVFPSFENDK